MSYSSSSGTEDYLQQYEPVSEQSAAPKKRFNLTTLSFWVILSAVFVLGAFAFYGLASAYPKQIRTFLITIDTFGITQVGANEQDRIRKINRLSITYEEKQVLIGRTIFFGATRDMVTLALGQPTCLETAQKTESSAAAEHWVYFIDGESKPTQLSFQNNTLVAAGKTSALDGCR